MIETASRNDVAMQAEEQSHPAVASGSQPAPTKQTRPRVTLEAGAKLSGRKYDGNMLRLRNKERHVRMKERMHGPNHPEVAHALLQVAKHHGESGAIQEQQEALRKALEAHDKHLKSQSLAVPQRRADELERRVKELEGALQEKSSQEKASVGTTEKGHSAAVMCLLEGQRQHDSHTDAVVREVYADQARVAEVIKLASKLWDSGILSPAPRRPPLMKSCLLVRLADRFHHAALRDALQSWWRRCSLQKVAEEVTRSGGVWPVPLEKHSNGQGQRHTIGGHESLPANGVWQDPRHVGVSSAAKATGKDQDEVRRLREELEALQAVVAQPASAHNDRQRITEENSRLRGELQEMRESITAQATQRNQAPMIVEQPDGPEYHPKHTQHALNGRNSRRPSASSQNHHDEEHSGLRADSHEMRQSISAPVTQQSHGLIILEQPDDHGNLPKHDHHAARGSDSHRSSTEIQSHHIEDHVQHTGGGSRRPSVDRHHQAAAPAPDDDTSQHAASDHHSSPPQHQQTGVIAALGDDWSPDLGVSDDDDLMRTFSDQFAAAAHRPPPSATSEISNDLPLAGVEDDPAVGAYPQSLTRHVDPGTERQEAHAASVVSSRRPSVESKQHQHVSEEATSHRSSHGHADVPESNSEILSSSVATAEETLGTRTASATTLGTRERPSTASGTTRGRLTGASAASYDLGKAESDNDDESEVGDEQEVSDEELAGMLPGM